MAYRNWMKEQGKPEPRLPGLENLEPQQMFWLSFAQTWCSVQTKGASRTLLRKISISIFLLFSYRGNAGIYPNQSACTETNASYVDTDEYTGVCKRLLLSDWVENESNRQM